MDGRSFPCDPVHKSWLKDYKPKQSTNADDVTRRDIRVELTHKSSKLTLDKEKKVQMHWDEKENFLHESQKVCSGKKDMITVAKTKGSTSDNPRLGLAGYLSQKEKMSSFQRYNLEPVPVNKKEPTNNYFTKEQGVVKTVSGQNLTGVRTIKITEATQLPQHAFQSLYADRPQAMTLYGGRMTASRLAVVGSVTSEAIERLHKQLADMPKSDVELCDPPGLTVPLMIHQRQALAWLTWREKQHPSGGILADDMGLGKTLTMISVIVHQKQQESASPDDDDQSWISRKSQMKKASEGLVQTKATLVVCPASLVHQWEQEIKRRCKPGLLSVVLYHGSNREKDVLKLAAADIVITTYNLVSKEVGAPPELKEKSALEKPAIDQDPDSTTSLLLRLAWHRVILDEAHNIKNYKSLTAIAMCRLRAGCRWGLTGTPIQNDLLDMYSLLRFLRCSPFDEYKVWKRQVDNVSETGQQRLNTLVKTLLLRRTKDQKLASSSQRLVELPTKKNHTHELELSPQERSVYDKVFKQSRKMLERYLAKQTGNTQGKYQPVIAASEGLPKAASQTAPSGGQVLLLLLRLRQCCSHISLLKDVFDEETLTSEGIDQNLDAMMANMSLVDEALQEPKTNLLSVNADFASIKIKALLEKINAIGQNSEDRSARIVVVSQWTSMLTIVERHLTREGFKCATIQGKVPAKTRTQIVEAFNTSRLGPDVLLVSLRAGGVGLNLIGGNHLFLLDMHWNPALEDQACDRIYRVGQTKECHVHKFVCKDTVEEKIVQLQKKKLRLATNILSGAKASSNKLTLDDLKVLFGLDRPKLPPPNQQSTVPSSGAHGFTDARGYPSGFRSVPNHVMSESVRKAPIGATGVSGSTVKQPGTAFKPELNSRPVGLIKPSSSFKHPVKVVKPEANNQSAGLLKPSSSMISGFKQPTAVISSAGVKKISGADKQNLPHLSAMKSQGHFVPVTSKKIITTESHKYRSSDKSKGASSDTLAKAIPQQPLLKPEYTSSA